MSTAPGTKPQPDPPTHEPIWLVYDGACPFCSAAAQTLRIRQAVGTLHILNARDAEYTPLMAEIHAQKLDLDAGIVVKFEGRLWHGVDAVHLLALIGSEQGWLNRLNVMLFRNRKLAVAAYPIMKALRNLSLLLLGKPQIKTGHFTATPTFAPVFGLPWQDLPPAIRKHYANRPFCRDRVIVEGRLDIHMGPVMQRLASVLAIFGMLTPCAGNDIGCTVHFLSEPGSNAFILERWFQFPGRKPYRFRSRLVPQGARVIEYMACGIGWDCTYAFEAGEVRLRHRGYIWRLFGIDVPITWLGNLLMGRGDAVEQATGEDSFTMRMTLSGGLFGKAMAYGYAGAFTVTEMTLDD